MNTLETVYESLFVPKVEEFTITSNGGYKKILSQLRNYFNAQMGDDVMQLLDRGDEFETFKERLILVIKRSNLDPGTKLHLIKKINRTNSLCALHSMLHLNEILS